MKFGWRSSGNQITVESDVTVTSRFIADLRAAIRINNRYMGPSSGPIRVVVCDSAQSWERASKYYFFPFARGLVLRDGTLILKSIRHAGLSRSQYRKLLVHEMNHLYWLRRVGRGHSMWSPLWLVEALACDVARGEYLLTLSALKELLRTRRNDRILSYRYRNSEIASREELIFKYSLWFRFLLFLKERPGFTIPAVLAGAKRNRSKAKFDLWFRRSFGAAPQNLLRAFISGLETS